MDRSYYSEPIAFGFIAVAVIWNIFVAPEGGAISHTIWRWTAKSPLVPFLFGMIAGHLFWRE